MRNDSSAILQSGCCELLLKLSSSEEDELIESLVVEKTQLDRSTYSIGATRMGSLYVILVGDLQSVFVATGGSWPDVHCQNRRRRGKL